MAFKAEPAQKQATYYSIKEGQFRVTTTKENPLAVAREYTNPKTKESGIAYEIPFKALFGKITDVSFRENTLKDGTVLRSININLGEDENGVAQIASMPMDSRFTSDFLKKLPAIDLEKEVRLMPYDFEPKEGPRQVGLSVMQPDADGNFNVKVFDFFVEKIEDGSKTRYVAKHGFPEPTDEDKADWPFYFKKVNKFLVKYATINILPAFRSHSEHVAAAKELSDQEFPKDEINPSDLPF